jgi:tetratricopeptide (TPR) repeat protein
MFDCLRLLEETGRREVALQRLIELAGNVKITVSNRLKAIRGIHRIGEERLALRLVEQISHDDKGNIRIRSGALIDLASFLLDVGLESEALTLCREALDLPLNLDDEDRLAIVKFLAEKGFSLEAKAVLRSLLKLLSNENNCSPGWVFFHGANILRNLGETAETLEALTTIARHASMDTYTRIEACRCLSSGHRAEDAREILRELSRRKSLSEDDRIHIAECCADVGLTQWAQEQVLDTLKDAELSSYARARIRKISSQVGLAARGESVSGWLVNSGK